MMVNAGKIWFVELFDCKLCLNSADILFSRCVQLCYSKRLCLSWMMNLLLVQTARAAETFRDLARPFEAAATFECNDSKNQTQNDNAQKTTWKRTLRAVTCTRGCTRSRLSSFTESERRVWRIGFRKRMLFIWSLVLLRDNTGVSRSQTRARRWDTRVYRNERFPLAMFWVKLVLNKVMKEFRCKGSERVLMRAQGSQVKWRHFTSVKWRSSIEHSLYRMTSKLSLIIRH